MKCSVCGTEFPAIRERHYIARDLTKTGVAAAFASTDEPALHDSFDCPNCGCQVIAQARKRVFIPYTDEELLEDIDNEALAAHLGITERQLETIYAAKTEGKRVHIGKEGKRKC